MKNEHWADIPGFDDLYQVSTLGRVRGLVRGGVLKTDVVNGGYLRVTLCKNGKTRRFMVHRLVATVFIPNNDIKREFVNHRDGIKTNNHIDNLQWCTSSENETHSYSTLGKINSSSKMVLDLETGIYYDSIAHAAVAKQINRWALRSRFHRKRMLGLSLILV